MGHSIHSPRAAHSLQFLSVVIAGKCEKMLVIDAEHVAAVPVDRAAACFSGRVGRGEGLFMLVFV